MGMSCCMKCLHNRGCCPLKLPCWETVIHCIPLVGIVSSLVAVIYREVKLDRIANLMEGGLDDLSPRKSRKMSLLAGNTCPGTDKMSLDEESPLRNQWREVSAKKLNCIAIFMINFLATVVAPLTGMIIYRYA